MATTFGVTSAKVLGPTKSTPVPGSVHSSVRSYSEQVVAAAQASGDIIVVGLIPKGAVFLYGIMEADASMGGTATIALSSVSVTAAGVATVVTAGKYRAAAIFTAVDTPTLVGLTANTGTALAADEIIGAVIAAASLPGSGNLKFTWYYAFN